MQRLWPLMLRSVLSRWFALVLFRLGGGLSVMKLSKLYLRIL